MTKDLSHQLSPTQDYLAHQQPIVYDLRQAKNRKSVEGLVGDLHPLNVVDDFVEQLRELYAVQHPTQVYQPNFSSAFNGYLRELEENTPLWQLGRWVYYPWLFALVHVLEDEEFQAVRTARNRYLITPEEQQKFYHSVVGIGGLSVGNSVALTIVLQGGGCRLRLADFDRLALSNTNRVRAGMHNLGLEKVEVTARQIYELNPYAQVDIFSEGLTPQNIERFLVGPPKLDIVVDELDNIAIKYLIREQAKKHCLPVVMGADNGDNAVIDVERYDLDPQPSFFHGRIGDVTYEGLKNLDRFGIGKTITQHIGPENITERMQRSLLEMGRTIVSWPQLGGAAMLNGSAVAYCVRRVLNGQEIEPNRALISLDEKLIPSYNVSNEVARRKTAVEGFKNIFGL